MSINERKHVDIVETELADADAQKVAELRTQLGADHDIYTDFALHRFIKYNWGNVAAAAKQWIGYLAFRKEKDLDNFTKQTFDYVAKMKKIVPYTYLDRDIDNRPVYWEKTGSLCTAALSDNSVMPYDEFLNLHIWGMEHLYEQCHQKSLQSKKRIDQFSSVLDMAGLGFHHRTCIFVLKNIMDFDNLYYPDRIARLFVLNTPWVAPAMYQLVTPLLPESIKQQINIINGKPDSVLLEKFPASVLPKEYGGEAEDIPVQDCTDLLKSASNKYEGLDEQLIQYDFTKELECDATGGTFSWFFDCEDGYDIDFSVEIKLANGTSIMAKQPSRCITNKGSYDSKEAAKVIFKWDNNFSYFANKTIHYNVAIAKQSDMAELESFNIKK